MQFLFKTPRLAARHFTLDDIELLNNLHSDKELMKTTSGSVQTLLETKNEIIEMISNQENHGVSQLAFFDKDENFAGRCGLIYRTFSTKDDFNFELRYAVKPNFQGLGYGYEMAKNYLDYIFITQNKNISNIIAAVRLDGHAASSKLLQKLGFNYLENRVFYSNKKECKIWEIKKADWIKI